MKIYLYEDRKDVYIAAYYPKAAKRPMPAVLICPGGGYYIVGTTEGRPVSDKFTDAGYAAFILHYTVGDKAAFGPGGFKDFAPAQDLDAAMRLLQKNADEYGINNERIALAGFSAGGHLCAAWCFSGAYTDSGLLPFALILAYPMAGGADKDYDIARMAYTDDPAVKRLPTFLWHAKDDNVVPFHASENLAARLAAEGIPYTFLAYEHGIHARPFFDPDWFYKALDWLAAIKKTKGTSPFVFVFPSPFVFRIKTQGTSPNVLKYIYVLQDTPEEF